MADTTSSWLLALPDPCLLAVMQCCANDTRSVFSTATAHSRLQRAAVEALSCIAARQLDKARLNSLLLYLAKHCQHVHSLRLSAPDQDVLLRELPPSLTKLDSLRLSSLTLQLQPGLDGTQDVLRAGFPLTRLELSRCTLLDGAQWLAAALMQLPDLQHLSVDYDNNRGPLLTFRTDVLSHLVWLTSLRLNSINLRDRNSARTLGAALQVLQPLQALTRLADLQLRTGLTPAHRVTAESLPGAGQLTRLVLSRQRFEPRALAGKTQLQHLTLTECRFVPGADVAQLLSELQHLTQLTHLDLRRSCQQPSPQPAAYGSLTASSKLQHLDVSYNTLPSAAWQYMCTPGRTLPQLRHLDITDVMEADDSPAAPHTSALVRCCPGLQLILTTHMPCSTAQLKPLQQLTGLQSLAVGGGLIDDLEGVHALCQLTGLQGLEVYVARAAEARILQLTQLTRLTALTVPQGCARNSVATHRWVTSLCGGSCCSSWLNLLTLRWRSRQQQRRR